MPTLMWKTQIRNLINSKNKAFASKLQQNSPNNMKQRSQVDNTWSITLRGSGAMIWPVGAEKLGAEAGNLARENCKQRPDNVKSFISLVAAFLK